MKFNNQQKSATITLLLTCLLFFTFKLIEIKRQIEELEIFVEISVEKDSNKQITEIKTNNVFNKNKVSTKKTKRVKLSKNDDFEALNKLTEELLKTSEINKSDYTTVKEKYVSKNNLKEELEKINKKSASKQKNSSNNKESSMSFDLKGRKIIRYNTPIYLCKNGGTIIVSITVDRSGFITSQKINSRTNSNDKCLIENALKYCKRTIFSPSNIETQKGTITYIFQKR